METTAIAKQLKESVTMWELLEATAKAERVKLIKLLTKIDGGAKQTPKESAAKAKRRLQVESEVMARAMKRYTGKVVSQ